MDRKKELLIKSGARLYSLGIDLEGARAHIRKLLENGAGYDAPEMIRAVKDYTELKKQWDNLEAEHLKTRSEILTGKD
ncbi:MAG: hypothetical protein IKP19_10485 [Oscillospiraceae bacterium]|nr:hypothetical protein [Oscillospiraceae bacterium]